jgi:hypothetical protein
MNTKINFKNWLIESEARKLRPELSDVDLKKLEVSIGDIVEMGPETEFKGKKANRISRVVKISGDTVLVVDLTKSGDKLIRLPIKELHDKEELRGSRIIPKEEAELKLLGGKRLWVRLTPRQYSKYASSYKAPKMPEIIPMTQEDKPSKVLKNMFSKTSQEKPEEILSIFDDEPKTKTSPLKRFLAAKKGIL